MNKKIVPILWLTVLVNAQRLPDLKLTPGVVAITDKTVLCRKSFHAKDERKLTDATKISVYHTYGLEPNQGYCRKLPRKIKKGKTVLEGCEIDHLISLELGGADTVANLWPQPYTEHPGAHEKDQLENWLHKQVCSGKMALTDAQHHVAINWYKEYQIMQKAKEIK